MKKPPKFDSYYDIVYRTKSGRAMVQKRFPGKTADLAKQKFIKSMRSSDTFEKVITIFKL